MNRFLFLVLSFFSIHKAHPFSYDLHLTKIPGTNSKTMICFHGMGGDYQIGPYLKETFGLEETVISFNFPDFGNEGNGSCYGSIDELLPAFYVLKKCVLDEGLKEVYLYGFSAGGGCIINILKALNSSTYDEELQILGITQEDKQKLLKAIQKGTILLDTPLKSVAEIIDFRGAIPELEEVGKRYKENGMEPIESLTALKGLKLHIILHFQNPDEILSNRDDDLFIERLKEVNVEGSTVVVLGNENGHLLPHPALWKKYTNPE